MIALKQYFEYYRAYHLIPKVEEGATIPYEEFIKSLELVESFSGPIDNMQDQFKQILKEKNGEIKFINFCHWAIRRSFIFQGLEKRTVEEMKERRIKSNFHLNFIYSLEQAMKKKASKQIGGIVIGS